MRRIVKGREPGCLQATRNTPGATTWKALPGDCKQTLREVAFAEQHGLCAYCQSRLAGTTAASSAIPDGKGMKIEHWAARHDSSAQVFDWENLLGVCPGIVVGGAADETGEAHCDTHRGRLPSEEQALFYHPANFPPDVGARFRYSHVGEMRPADETDQGAARDIERLHLNADRLKRNRAGVIKALRNKLEKAGWRDAALMRLYEEAKTPDKDGLLPPYSQVAVLYLEKKIRASNPGRGKRKATQ